MKEQPKGNLVTPIGPIHFCMTQADHVFLHTENELITIRGIPYHVSYHCYLIGGQWTAKDWYEPHLSRKDRYLEPSLAARKTARTTLAKAWAEHLTAHPELSRQAALARAESEVEKLADELESLEQKVNEKRKELAAAKKMLAAI